VKCLERQVFAATEPRGFAVSQSIEPEVQHGLRTDVHDEIVTDSNPLVE